MSEGIGDELQGIDLGDQRLNKRSKKVIQALATNPQASVNAACEGWSDTLAAYRFFNNQAVSPDQILQPHLRLTHQRMREHPIVLIVQDTTELDFTNHPTNDARCLNKEHRFGLYQHVQLAVTPDKLCLGVVGIEFFDRAPETLGLTNERTRLPIEMKESFRWLKGYRTASESAATFPETRLVSIADREADIYDIFIDAHEQIGLRADYIIRAKEDRSTLDRNPAAGPAAYGKVRDEVGRSTPRTTRTLELGQTPKRAARQAQLEIRAITVTTRPPHARSSLPPVTHHVVLVEEVGGPSDDTKVDWLLLTTLPIDTVDDILRVIDYYATRWTAEIFFRTLKTGCRVEEIQLETNHRLKNCLAFYNIIAWRLLYLTYLNRTSPELPCTTMFEPSEWKSVWRVVKKQPLPKRPPTLSAFLRLLTQLGGYNNRVNEPAPGPQPIWIGLRRMTDFATAWLAFGPDT